MDKPASFHNSLVDFILAMVVPGTGAPLAFIANILIARYLGADSFGNYMVLLSTAYIFAGIINLGTDQVLIREIAAERNRSDSDHRQRLVRWAQWRFSLASVVGSLLLLIWLRGSSWLYSGTTSLELVSTLLLGWSSALLILVAAFLAGRGNVVASQALGNPIRNGILLIAIVYLAWRQTVVEKTGAMLLLQAASFLIVAWAGWLWLRRRQTGGVRAPDSSATHAGARSGRRVWSKAAWMFFIGSLGTLLLNRLDVILVAYMSDAATAGLYGAALRTAQFVAMLGNAALVWLQPRVAFYYRQGDMVSLLWLLRRGALVIVSASFIALLVVLFAADAIAGWLGVDFSAAAGPLRLIAFGYFVWALALPLFVFLSMTGSETAIARILWLQLGLNGVLTVLLVPQMGVMGAALSWFIGMAIAAILIGFTGWSSLERIGGAVRRASKQ